MTSSPLRAGATLEDELEYYKKQYEQLETDLADFQSSSKELEEQLERDIEAAEKNERRLKEQVERLGFEVEEWKTKHKQAKAEANNAQNALQKEITTIRDAHRTLHLKLRDIEVANDDYERQARNTESSLEDLDSKYNVSIERAVMLEEEMKIGEQEREALRIETQRLRDELGDLKVESEITLEKLRLADGTIDRLRSRKPSPLAVESLRARSPGSEVSGITPSSPTASTPPPKSDSMSDAPTPPSPPLSDTPAHTKLELRTPAPSSRRSLLPDSATPRPSLYGPRTAPKHSRATSIASSTASDVRAMKPPAPRPRQVSRQSITPAGGLPRSDSLYQIKALRGRMQKIEERVHSARSKLPAPGTTTPRGSPRAPSTLGQDVPSSVTLRRSIRRPTGSQIGSVVSGETGGASSDTSRRESHVKRLSYGIPRPPSSASERPTSALDRPPSAAAATRPSSRTSMASANAPPHRPESRSGVRTPGRPRSSMAGNYATIHGTPRSHRPSASISELRRTAAESEDSALTSTPSRRTTIDKTGLPTPFGSRRQSGGVHVTPVVSRMTGRRTSTGVGSLLGDGEMKPPPLRRKMSDVGETF